MGEIGNCTCHPLVFCRVRESEWSSAEASMTHSRRCLLLGDRHMELDGLVSRDLMKFTN